MDEEIDVVQAKEMLNSDITRFVTFYQNGMQFEPNHFPEKMSEEDWFDQFLSFVSTDGE